MSGGSPGGARGGGAPASTPVTALLSLAGRTAWVAGGGGGIGRAVAARLHEAGAAVVSIDRPGVDAGPGVRSVACDLADPESLTALLAAPDAGLDRADVLVHCAGITRDGVLWKLADDDWAEVMAVNLDSAFRLLRAVVPGMRAAGGGAVVLVGSINGERGKFGQANYAASKAGLLGLARTAARELGSFGIRVNVVEPGLVETAMTAGLPDDVRQRAVDESALGRVAAPDDVARAILFLASDAARHVTGQVLRVDGGQLIG